VLRPDVFASGAPDGDGIPDLAWFNAAGLSVSGEEWNDSEFRVVQMFRRTPIPGGCDALIIINGRLDPVSCVLPGPRPATVWNLAWDSAWETPVNPTEPTGPANPGDTITLDDLSMRLYLSAPTS
jgi:glycogen operon protein